MRWAAHMARTGATNFSWKTWREEIMWKRT